MKFLPRWLAAVAILFPALAGAQFTNFPKASLVLGQNSFNTKGSNTTARSLRLPAGVAIDPTTNKVFVADTGNNRILRYADIDTLSNGAPAEAVLGQTGIALGLPNQGGTVARATLAGPTGIFVDTLGTLWVADTGNNRVLGFQNAASLTNGQNASLALGQPNFVSSSDLDPPTENSLSGPTAVWADLGNRLWVADTGNNRVLRYDNLSNLLLVTFNGAPARGVLGQAVFTTRQPKPTRFGLFQPRGLAVDSGGRLWVADSRYNRVLRFDNAAALRDGGQATRVIGQRNFTSTNPGRGSAELRRPTSLFVDIGGSLWVADRGNKRILRFDNAAGLPNGRDAKAVIGQPNFSSTKAGTSNREVDFLAGGLAIDSTNRLWLADDRNNRVLRFTPLPAVEVLSGLRIETSRKRVRISGTASDASGIDKVLYKVGNIPFKTARGKKRWFFRAPVQPGRTIIKVVAISKLGNRSDPVRVRVTRR